MGKQKDDFVLGQDHDLGDIAKASVKLLKTEVQAVEITLGGKRNSAVVGAYIEELIRGMIRDWIFPKHIGHGAIWPPCSPSDGPAEPKQINGIVWDNRLGPPKLSKGDFVVAHPRAVVGVIEIKMSEDNIKRFRKRLKSIKDAYLKDAFPNRVMGIVICRNCSRKFVDEISTLNAPTGAPPPVFVLFGKEGEELVPHHGVFERMVAALYNPMGIIQHYPTSQFDQAGRAPLPGAPRSNAEV